VTFAFGTRLGPHEVTAQIGPIVAFAEPVA
jgi:hypothetical protein